MIKNAKQLQSSIRILNQVNKEIEQINNDKNLLIDKEIYLIPLFTQKNTLEDQIIEYQFLTNSNFKESIDNLLNKPFLLDNIGELLAKIRIASKLSQTEMANRLGWEQSNLSRFESENYSSQTISKIVEYASALGVWLHVRPSITEQIDFSPINHEKKLEYQINISDVNTNSFTNSELGQGLLSDCHDSEPFLNVFA
ncbi:MAG TPA: hypothetical protein DIW44_13940 [Anaerolineaceae bacterium]|nr:hypothetical protein [Anaerolineaceae bacterium]